MTHSELDDLFRANGERGEFTPQAEEWEAMTRLLDADDRRVRLGKLMSLAWMALFVGLIAWGTYGAYRVLQPDEQLTETAELTTPELPSGTAPVVAAPAPSGKTVLAPASGGLAVETTGDAPSSQLARDGVREAARGMVRETSALSEERRSAPPASALPVSVQNRAGSAAGQDVAAAHGAVEASASPKVETQAAVDLNFTRLPLRAWATPTDGGDVPLQVLPVRRPPQPTLPKPRLRPQLSYGLLGAGEVTSVGMERALRWGARGGVIAHVGLGRHWEAQLGLSYGRKRYHAAPDHYHMAEGFWVGGVAATDTESAADIWEVPLLATYHLRDRRRESSVFVSAGLTSYLLRKETFAYSYSREVPDQNHGHSMYNQHRTVLGIAQFQLGYRLLQGDRLTYRISPFVSVPLSGVGYGDVQLYTGGVSVEVELR